MPRIALGDHLAFIALDGVALTGLGVGGIAQLHEHGLALASALDRGAEEAVRAVWDGGLHGLADHLGDEHAGAQLVA